MLLKSFNWLKVVFKRGNTETKNAILSNKLIKDNKTFKINKFIQRVYLRDTHKRSLKKSKEV